MRSHTGELMPVRLQVGPEEVARPGTEKVEIEVNVVTARTEEKREKERI
jgi:hypothetical protein